MGGAPYWYSHVTDFIRLAVLYNEGGVYVDTDVLVLKSFASLGNNVIGLQSMNKLNGAVMKFEKGSEYIKACLEEYIATYDPTVWNSNGPALLSRVRARPRFHRQPQLVRVLPPDAFYPFRGGRLIDELCFKSTAPAKRSKTLARIERHSYALHLNGRWSTQLVAQNGSVCDRLFAQSRIAATASRGHMS